MMVAKKNYKANIKSPSKRYSLVGGRGRIAQWIAFLLLASRPAAPGLIPSVPKIFRNFMMLLRFIDSTLLKEWTVQSLIVDQAHLVLASGKQDLQKRYSLVQTKFKIGYGL